MAVDKTKNGIPEPTKVKEREKTVRIIGGTQSVNDKPSALAVAAKLQDFYHSALLARAYVELWSEEDFCAEDKHSSSSSPALSMVRDSVVRRVEIMGQALDDIAKSKFSQGTKSRPPEKCMTCGQDIRHGQKSEDTLRLRHNGIDDSYWYGLRSFISHNYEDIDYRLLWNLLRHSYMETALEAVAEEIRDFGAPVPVLKR